MDILFMVITLPVLFRMLMITPVSMSRHIDCFSPKNAFVADCCLPPRML